MRDRRLTNVLLVVLAAAIFVLALMFLALFVVIMNRTRLGLQVRAVTQNPVMAASMGINPDRIAMMTFGLGSGIAAIGIIASYWKPSSSVLAKTAIGRPVGAMPALARSASIRSSRSAFSAASRRSRLRSRS